MAVSARNRCHTNSSGYKLQRKVGQFITIIKGSLVCSCWLFVTQNTILYGSIRYYSIIRIQYLHEPPEPEDDIDGIGGKIPYDLLGDEIFLMTTWLMRLHPRNLAENEQLYNYRQSRGRHPIENRFRNIQSGKYPVLYGGKCMSTQLSVSNRKLFILFFRVY